MLTLLIIEDNERLQRALKVGLESTGAIRWSARSPVERQR